MQLVVLGMAALLVLGMAALAWEMDQVDMAREVEKVDMAALPWEMDQVDMAREVEKVEGIQEHLAGAIKE
ncbi:hypothetical protein [Prochlorococcus sp. MIT 1201]|uniref:hypothetical protein n=1 Tax=Prochlorococcus sp. MIT 1201 TaxID=3082535 RepID=UPI0039A5148C